MIRRHAKKRKRESVSCVCFLPLSFSSVDDDSLLTMSGVGGKGARHCMRVGRNIPKMTRAYVQSNQSGRRTNDNIPKYTNVDTYI